MRSRSASLREIADLEIKTADLEAAKAELERQKEEEKTFLGEKVLRLVLDYEKSDRAVELINSQLQTFALQNQVFYVQYRFGEGTTQEYLGMQEIVNMANNSSKSNYPKFNTETMWRVRCCG